MIRITPNHIYYINPPMLFQDNKWLIEAGNVKSFDVCQREVFEINNGKQISLGVQDCLAIYQTNGKVLARLGDKADWIEVRT